MKINNNLFLFTLIVCGYIYSDIADLEKQIANKIIYRNVLLGHAQKYPNHNPKLNVFRCCIDSTLANMPKAHIELTKEPLEEQCKNLTEDALWHTIFKNEQDLVALKENLLALYNAHNNELKPKALVSVATTILATASSLALYREYPSLAHIAITVAVLSMISTCGLFAIKYKNPICLNKSILFSKARLYDYMQQIQKENKVDEQ